jgi:hypothetical protein
VRISEYNIGCHVPAASIEVILKLCPMCGNSISKSVYFIQEKPFVEIRNCSNCKTSFASRFPDHDFLEGYYSNYYKGHNDDQNVTTNSAIRFARHIARFSLEKFGDFPSTKFKILDYGGGDGSIGVEVAKIINRKRIIDVDIDVFENQSSLYQVDKRIECNYFFETNDLSLDYNLIIASGVLEHVRNPFEVLITMVDRLAVGGMIYIRTPYVLPTYRLLKFFGSKQDFGYPAHFFDFSPTSWGKISRMLMKKYPTISVYRTGASPSEVGISKKPFLGLITVLLKMPTNLGLKYWPFCGGYEIVLRKGFENE